MLFWALMASGQITMLASVAGKHSTNSVKKPIDLAA